MKKLLFASVVLLCFSCENLIDNPCYYSYECNSGCIEQVNDKYYCSHCCLAESKKPDNYEELDIASKETPLNVSKEELKLLTASH